MSHSILNKFAPRHSIFLQELEKKKEINLKEFQQKQSKLKENKKIRMQTKLSKLIAIKEIKNALTKDFYGIIFKRN